MSLTVTQIQNTKPQSKAIKLFDGRGLYLEITPTGNRWWRFKYRFGDKEKRISLGVYPEVGLREARERLDVARKQVTDGTDPAEHRKNQKAELVAKVEESFETIAREWFERHHLLWKKNHSEKIIRRLERDIFPWIGTRHIRGILPHELLSVLRRIESRGALDTAHRALQNCGQIFRYGVATGRADRDITADLKGALPPAQGKHYASITDPKAVGELIRAINGYQGTFITKCALRLAPLVFLRPGELRRAEWKEFDFDTAEWRIPAEKMKMKAPHIVPLSKQAIAILRELQPLTGRKDYVFPGVQNAHRPMSENTVNSALRRLGYSKDEMTGHGFRSMASTLLNEQGWNRDAIERQLAHAERDEIRAAYNYAEYLPERRKMMQAWANYLDGLVATAKVLSIHHGRAA